MTGRLRPRSTHQHAKRLDIDRYAARVSTPACGKRRRVAVVGAGMAGLMAARTLADQGHAVSVFEKSRGLGGRAATRRADPLQFDHGAQFFTARHPTIRALVSSWIEDGVVATWTPREGICQGGRITDSADQDRERLVALPGMSALGRHLGRDLEIHRPIRISAPHWNGNQWRLSDGDNLIQPEFDALIVATPAPQTSELLQAASSAIAAKSDTISYDPCWTLMLEPGQPDTLPWDVIRFADGPLVWAARDSHKPGRRGDTWVVHASPQWSQQRLDLDRQQAARELSAIFADISGFEAGSVKTRIAHRWLYSLVSEPLAEDFVADDDQCVVACGDWCRGGRIEDALLSGQAAAAHLLRRWAQSARHDSESLNPNLANTGEQSCA